MEFITGIWKKNRWLLIGPILAVATILYLFTGWMEDEPDLTHEPYADEAMEEAAAESEAALTELEAAKIFVDVGGAVVRPGVVMLDSGARVFEAIDAAGGIGADGETKYLNLAALCSDGEKLYVPTIEETEQISSQGSNVYTAVVGSADSGLQPAATGKININTASSSELQTLNGIGPSMASRILEYRAANGSFGSIDELTKVSGIGEKTLAKIAEDICV